MKLLERLSTVFGTEKKPAENAAERALVADTVEAIIDAVNPCEHRSAPQFKSSA